MLQNMDFLSAGILTESDNVSFTVAVQRGILTQLSPFLLAADPH